MIPKKELPLCPVATTVGLIGNKWKLLILRDLLTGTKRFGELRKRIPDISQKVLTQNLRSMEEDGIIIREVYAEVPPRVEYRLSDLGNSLKPIIGVMEVWGLNYQKVVNEESEHAQKADHI
ncbi:helix-turn-helix transcriptional regulator [Paenibacillus alginolyticus]|uniref:Helix-turn-helix transcriptional regulator n=1 Tax=Paenibacillus alginolyticus TaxID=59839 RepID=A0ABT4G6J2_9BACL|nr:helix-turn-helix domain-containing protein [Paenibacillus alginolyticus]MCY9668883.1 helix-turn-helix transcriptional regulator [Paenibacillus alginolyticus]MCY9691796.1 helix-turn-helix transcriptional regulator [Paenibacillus alginolyticus]MEC0143239.1 helix-turn-helix domain-containing protein [Paenibacillus alginolyticus]